jgi:predicted amino acid-binding ACT domain protein
MVTTPVRPSFVFMPLGRAAVEADGEAVGRSLVRVTAQDQIGLLWAVCRWFADHGISIESVHASTRHGVASDTFVVAGKVDAEALAAHLGNPGADGHRSRLGLPTSWCPFHHG